MASRTFIEQLESRVLMTTVIQNVVADNRGLTNIYFSGPLMGSTVTTSSVVVFLAGQDGQLNTSDDVQAPATVTYGGGQNRIVVYANLPQDTAYCISVKGNLVKDAGGNFIDGEYTGSLPSGNNTPGGNFRFDANQVPIDSKIATFYIANQRVNVKLYAYAQLQLTIPNFLNYVNNGQYDGTFIHRTANTSQAGVNIVQGGAFYVASDPIIGEHVTPSNNFIAEEPVFSNILGTIAMAKQNSPHTTSNQWYFNETDNTNLDGGYSVFGKITNLAGEAVITNLFNNTKQLDLTSTIDQVTGATRYGDYHFVGQLDAVPTFNLNAQAATADPSHDFIIVSRVAIRQVVTPVPQGLPAIRSGSVFAAGVPISYTSAQPLAQNGSNCDDSLLASDKLKL